MSAVDISAIAVGIVTVLGGTAAFLQFLVKHYLAELKPNGGSSMNDRLTRVEAMLEVLVKGK
jgi:glyoxylate utilization-related uncharacterized protein